MNTIKATVLTLLGFFIVGCNTPYITNEKGAFDTITKETSFSYIMSSEFVKRKNNIDFCAFAIEERIRDNTKLISATTKIVAPCSFGKTGDVVYYNEETASIKAKPMTSFETNKSDD